MSCCVHVRQKEFMTELGVECAPPPPRLRRAFSIGTHNRRGSGRGQRQLPTRFSTSSSEDLSGVFSCFC